MCFAFTFLLFFLFLFFSFFLSLLLCTRLRGQTVTVVNSSRILLTFQPLFINLMGPVNSARDLQTSFFSNFFIKNGSYGIIHTFKNYFATVFSIFSFSKISSIQMDLKRDGFCIHPNSLLLALVSTYFVYIVDATYIEGKEWCSTIIQNIPPCSYRNLYLCEIVAINAVRIVFCVSATQWQLQDYFLGSSIKNINYTKF